MKELKFVEHIRKQAAKPGGDIVIGIGDDCAVLKYDLSKYLLWATDMLVEDTHFKVKQAPYGKIGRKAVAVNISDVAAMGGIPKYITVNIGIPGHIKQSALHRIYDGIFSICKDYGIRVIGGDTNRSRKLVIDVSIMGFVEKKYLLKRSGAKAGELILITGPVRDGKRQHLDFTPRLKEARFLSENYNVSSMIDVSDGIAPDLRRICLESKVGCRIYAGALPLSRGLSLKDALYFGESFELLFTMGIKEAKKLFLNIKKHNWENRYFVIGEILAKKRGMKIVGEEGHVTKLEMKGYQHI